MIRHRNFRGFLQLVDLKRKVPVSENKGCGMFLFSHSMINLKKINTEEQRRLTCEEEQREEAREHHKVSAVRIQNL